MPWPAAEGILRPHDRGDLGGGIHRPVELESALAQPEAREDARAVADDRDAERLEALERRGDVEHRLDPRAHDRDRRVREGREVGRLVERVGRAAVHPAEPAGREYADARERRQVRGRGDGRRRTRTACLDDRKVAHARLREVLVGDAPDALIVEADAGDAVEHRDRGGGHALIAEDRLEFARRLEIARAREPVGDDRGLEGDDRRAPRSSAAETSSDTTNAGMRPSSHRRPARSPHGWRDKVSRVGFRRRAATMRQIEPAEEPDSSVCGFVGVDDGCRNPAPLGHLVSVVLRPRADRTVVLLSGASSLARRLG